ncbi:hypothetical protein PACTADRAFT_49644 [Pachysolen tannophilus NRRL Y-2460]|uniref:FAD dependent oxidoreductase domain-containing protein n=1 Tax=Pachysolen tannophilus NRRL Y-2460 TaxID=669874 RepID=A0A1E4TX05_PACTA|nr:hypothetical protein PACTADRAFT_49644 [Pachysolen tannophilus NRRL Y-2460]
MLQPEEHVVIVGAGTFGLSTAVELLRKGHKNLTILDPYPVPSPLSAGNDVNKVFQSRVEDEFYSELALESLRRWKTDPLYKPAFHETGIIYAAVGEKAVEEIQRRKQALKNSGKEIVELDEPEHFARLIKYDMNIEDLKLSENNRFTNWKGYHQKTECGWTFASLALKNVAEECVKLGAKIVVDKADTLLYDENDSCIGVKTYCGEFIYAKKVVICAGANSIKLLDFKGQLLAKCWTVGHIKLSDEEAKSLKNSPVVLNLDEGFFFEPDGNNDLKFCNEFPGYINMEKIPSNQNLVSVPIYKSEIPSEAEDQMRGFLTQVFPQLAERSFNVTKICWCTDTPDRHFLFCEHVQGLVLGTGDSGKGFKYMPVVGDYISEIVLKGEQSLPKTKREAWAWRPTSERDIYALQGRWGGSNAIKDLKDVKNWTTAKRSKS